MIDDQVLQRIAAHYFYRHLPEEIYIELQELLIPYYSDEEPHPLEDEMVALAINFLSGIFYNID